MWRKILAPLLEVLAVIATAFFKVQGERKDKKKDEAEKNAILKDIRQGRVNAARIRLFRRLRNKT